MPIRTLTEMPSPARPLVRKYQVTGSSLVTMLTWADELCRDRQVTEARRTVLCLRLVLPYNLVSLADMALDSLNQRRPDHASRYLKRCYNELTRQLQR